MPLEAKGDDIDNPHIPENYYIGELSGINTYERDGKDAVGFVLQFDVEHDDETYTIPFFAPGKLSLSDQNESSRLGENLQKIGLLEPVTEVLDCRDEVMSQDYKWYAASDGEVADLESALRGVLAGKKVRVNVEDNQEGDASQVSKLSKVFDGDEGGGE